MLKLVKSIKKDFFYKHPQYRYVDKKNSYSFFKSKNLVAGKNDRRIRFLGFYIFIIVTVLGSYNANSQSRIMDMSITWTPSGGSYTAVASIFLTDTISLNGLKFHLGTHTDSSDLVNVQYPFAAGSGFSGAAASVDSNNVIHVQLGSIPDFTEYYAKVEIMLQSGQENVIAIKTEN